MKGEEQNRIFKEWISDHKGLLFKFVRAYAFSPEDRDDLFQEIAIQVWRSIPKFKGESAISTWLYRIAVNTSIAWTRKEKKQSETRIGLNNQAYLLRNPSQSNDQLDWLYEQIAGLDEIDRTLTMLLLDGFSYREMSSVLGITESNVGVKINRIKKFLISKSKKTSNHGV